MAYMDLNTFELFHEVDFTDEDYKSSREKTVGDDGHATWVELDDLIAPVISELNKKGYKTLFSCSGHAAGMSLFFSKNFKLYPHAYIKFDEGIVIPKDLIPLNWKYEKEINAIYFYYDIYPIFTSEKTSNLVEMQKKSENNVSYDRLIC